MKIVMMIGILAGGCGDDHAVAIDAARGTDAARADAFVRVDAPPPHPDGGGPAVGSALLADTVVAPTGVAGTDLAVNGVRGGGTNAGGTDVYSLGYTPDVNDSITLAWSGGGVLANGPGPDLVVFENAFAVAGGGGGVFMDLVIVEVSRDGATWFPIAHRYASATPAVYTNDPALWQGFAGKTPVLLNADTNVVDPFDQDAAGGDQLDLQDIVGEGADAEAIREGGVSYVRLVSAPARINPDTGATYVHEPVSNGADIDGMYGRYVVVP